jgi:hypothetical protein
MSVYKSICWFFTCIYNTIYDSFNNIYTTIYDTFNKIYNTTHFKEKSDIESDNDRVYKCDEESLKIVICYESDSGDTVYLRDTKTSKWDMLDI